jgi:hypothetical protein
MLKTFTCSLACGALLSFQCIHAQEVVGTPTVSKVESNIDFALAFGANAYSTALGFNRTHGLLKSHKLRIGYGVRLSSLFGQNLNYTSAPPELSLEPTLVDTLLVASPITLGLNANIHLGYFITPKFQVGFNIDVIGLGFGATNRSTFISSDNNGQFAARQTARPTSMNVLLVGDKDIGQLKSEFVLAYRIKDQFLVRAGADFTFSEYTTLNELTNTNDRFRHKAMMGFVGISYKIGSKTE